MARSKKKLKLTALPIEFELIAQAIAKQMLNNIPKERKGGGLQRVGQNEVNKQTPQFSKIYEDYRLIKRLFDAWDKIRLKKYPQRRGLPSPLEMAIGILRNMELDIASDKTDRKK